MWNNTSAIQRGLKILYFDRFNFDFRLQMGNRPNSMLTTRL